MKTLCKYMTKAKWTLHTKLGLPVLGYYTDGAPYGGWRDTIKSKPLLRGENVVLSGRLNPAGVSRGRSAVSFHFRDSDDNSYSMTAQNTQLFMELVLSGDIEQRDGAFFGYWTTSKQGTEVSLKPLTKFEANEILEKNA